MKESFESSIKLPKSELTVEQCIKKADSLITKNGQCLFLLDVKNSRQGTVEDRNNLQKRLTSLLGKLNNEFDQYFPINNLALITRQEKGYYSLLGDGSWVGIDNSEVIPKIVDYIHTTLPDVHFRFGIAKDGYDKEALKLIR